MSDKKLIRHENGIVEIQGLRRTTWGFDARFNGRRIRRFGMLSRSEAEQAKEDLDEGLNPYVGRVAGCGQLKVGGIGAAAELIVCVDLLQQGYDVFRSVSINAACDLIAATDDGRLCRVEVKSAIHRGNTTRFKRHRLDPTKHDILALVFLREQEIQYSESVEKWFLRNENGANMALIQAR